MTLQISTEEARRLLEEGRKTQALGESLMTLAGLKPDRCNAVNIGYTVIRFLRSNPAPATLTLRLYSASAEIINAKEVPQ